MSKEALLALQETENKQKVKKYFVENIIYISKTFKTKISPWFRTQGY